MTRKIVFPLILSAETHTKNKGKFHFYHFKTKPTENEEENKEKFLDFIHFSVCVYVKKWFIVSLLHSLIIKNIALFPSTFQPTKLLNNFLCFFLFLFFFALFLIEKTLIKSEGNFC